MTNQITGHQPTRCKLDVWIKAAIKTALFTKLKRIPDRKVQRIGKSEGLQVCDFKISQRKVQIILVRLPDAPDCCWPTTTWKGGDNRNKGLS